MEAVLTPVTSGIPLGACLPGGPVPIVNFAMDEITHIKADEEVTLEETNPTAPRCAGDPPPKCIHSVPLDEHRSSMSIRKGIADLRVQLQLLENRD